MVTAGQAGPARQAKNNGREIRPFLRCDVAKGSASRSLRLLRWGNGTPDRELRKTTDNVHQFIVGQFIVPGGAGRLFRRRIMAHVKTPCTDHTSNAARRHSLHRRGLEVLTSWLKKVQVLSGRGQDDVLSGRSALLMKTWHRRATDPGAARDGQTRRVGPSGPGSCRIARCVPRRARRSGPP